MNGGPLATNNAWPVGLARLYPGRSSDGPSVSIWIRIFHMSGGRPSSRVVTQGRSCSAYGATRSARILGPEKILRRGIGLSTQAHRFEEQIHRFAHRLIVIHHEDSGFSAQRDLPRCLMAMSCETTHPRRPGNRPKGGLYARPQWSG